MAKYMILTLKRPLYGDNITYFRAAKCLFVIDSNELQCP